MEASDGQSLLDSPTDRERTVYIESMVPLLTYGWAPLTGLRRHEDKYIHAPTPEYYRLDEQPLERNNRWESSQGAAGLVAELTAYSTRWGELDATEPLIDPEVADKLAALGYVRSTYRPPGERKNPRDMVEVWDAISQAEMYSLRGDHARALSTIKSVVRQDPEDGRAWYTMALIHRRDKQFGRAEEALRRSVAHAPNPDAYMLLAQLQASRRAFDEFDATIEAARALEPDNGQIQITMGDRLAIEGRFDEALTAFERALALDPVRAGPLAREKIAAARARLGLR
jgi:Tfp pilus assembly protein PilF